VKGDAWFRWRDAGGLRDRTIESTWWRVARAVAAVEVAQAEAWSRRYYDAFAQWRLLPDEALLRGAGTRVRSGSGGALSATLNVAAFVRAPRGGLDLDAFADTAALAVRLLDDARLAGCAGERHGSEVRIGVLGMADALRELGADYDSTAARDIAAGVASALAHGALRGAVELARERGRTLADEAPDGAAMSPRLDAALRADYEQWGSRYARLTAIAPQPRLARLANAASDALDPAGDTAQASLLAQLQLRTAMQPWIDAPIDYPLLAPDEGGDEQVREVTRYAQAQGIALPAIVARAPAA